MAVLKDFKSLKVQIIIVGRQIYGYTLNGLKMVVLWIRQIDDYLIITQKSQVLQRKKDKTRFDLDDVGELKGDTGCKVNRDEGEQSLKIT